MNRRTFINHLSAGVALQSIPVSLLAGATSSISSDRPAAAWLDNATDLIGSGSLGTLQRVAITRIYSPELTSLPVLRKMVSHDFDLADRLLGMNLSIDPNTLFADSPSSFFGSYSTCLNRAGLALTWQGLARLGSRATESSSTLRIMGSQGVLEMALDKGSYKLINLQGKLVRAYSGGDPGLKGAVL